MIFFPRLHKLFVVSLSIYLSACTVPERNRSGTELSIFPVTHTLSLRTEKADFDQSRQQLEAYIKEYSGLLKNQSIVLSWFSPTGKKLVDFSESRLFEMGIAPSSIQYEKMNTNSEPHFDFIIKVVQYQIENRVCTKSISQNYFLADGGCITENARWKSMVAPERMLPSLKQAQE